MFFDFFSKPRPQQKLPFATDMHCHIVPGVDDGSPDVETSLQLLESMNEWGLKRIFASPHSTQDNFENTPQTLAEPFAALKQGAGAMPVELDFHLEYRIDEFFIDQLEAANVRPLPGNYLLIENGFSHEPWGIDNLVCDLMNRGFNPVLAHPERYHYYSRKNARRLKELHDLGLYFQINLLSLAGHYGKFERRAALSLLESNMVQFVGTDLHRASHVESINSYLCSRNFEKDIKLIGHLHNDAL
ncbi:MAG: hypothetical protein HDR45_01850 [Bacteroides sp.]|nr:hypothetical protein [Bacteroidales bacterium]MBD5187905.1 hypothetical protein [Bacteroidales bacterium]MBD5326599.1 hypothetical protein [Bacteroides sp.]MBD5424924.1 hypothetical protein [Bacteroides sp.]